MGNLAIINTVYKILLPIPTVGCRKKLMDWRCKYWLPWHILCWILIVAICITGYTTLSISPNISPADVTPRYILNDTITEIDTGTSLLDWVSTMKVIVPNCTGTVLVFQDTNCSGLVETRKRECLYGTQLEKISIS